MMYFGKAALNDFGHMRFITSRRVYEEIFARKNRHEKELLFLGVNLGYLISSDPNLTMMV